LEERTKNWWLGEATGNDNGWKKQQGMTLVGGENQDLMVEGKKQGLIMAGRSSRE
jgi:hypothetical protein